jgi:hypothetical protein
VTIPEQAIERYRKLSARADDLNAAIRANYEESHHLRTEITRLRHTLKDPQTSYALELSPEGEPLVFDRMRGTWVVLNSPGLQANGRSIVKLEAELKLVQQRSAELSERFQCFRSLADACQDELIKRGWQGGGTDFIGGTTPGFGTPVGAVRLNVEAAA